MFCDNVVYQIFPERFAIGLGDDKSVSTKIEAGLYPEKIIAKEWNDLPLDVENLHNEMFGGDLQGIIDNIDYIKDLGVTALYLNPIFPSDSSHKYDSYDYYSVDKSFGGNEIFEELVAVLHENGLKLIIDLVLNHISNKHPLFLDAIGDPNSQKRSYFKFSHYPEEYDCWWGFKTMPELQLEHSDVVEEFITGKDSVIRYWAKKGVDGIRLDCANDLGPNICRLISETVHEVDPSITVIGEIFNFAPDFAHSLDSQQTYFFTSAILNILAGSITSVQFGKILDRAVKDFPHEKLIQNLNILSSHDSPRVLTELNNNIDALKLALMLQFTLPGVPKIYYGDEIAMKGEMDPHNRAPMIWEKGRWNHSVRDYVKSLISLRKERKELRSGKTVDLSQWLENGVVAFLRYAEDEPSAYSVVVVNTTCEEKDFKLFLPYSYVFSNLLFADLLSNATTTANMGEIAVTIEAQSSAIYVPKNLYKKNYNFFKRITTDNR